MSRGVPSDLLGMKFGKLTVIGKSKNPNKDNKTGRFWLCKCDCGGTKIASTSNLNYGIISSCGCLRSEVKIKARLSNKFVENVNFVEYKDNSGNVFVVDYETHMRMKNHNRYWYVNKHIHDNGRIEEYVVSKINNKSISLHRFIMEPKDGYIVDHIDGNGLNNKKNNLRLVKINQNNMNKGIAKNNTSGHTGVTWDKQRKKWRVRIQKNKKSINLGTFDSYEEAVEVRKNAEIKYYREYSRQYGSIYDKTITDINID